MYLPTPNAKNACKFVNPCPKDQCSTHLLHKMCSKFTLMQASYIDCISATRPMTRFRVFWIQSL